ncbi:16S rRNA (cytosine(1402)-N(4))-methyltransferase RsmH [Candidatus Uhrbacteria bacterium]|nr:16S rRNA (cytosine(1402)-N(4))-methyltransferase RsmH [Candidatus Uhrbacteria bacterium]
MGSLSHGGRTGEHGNCRGAWPGTRRVSGHIPVLCAEVLAHIALHPGDAAVDCTFGGGGYTRAMLAAVLPEGRVLALDQDPEAIAHGRAMDWVRAAGEHCELVHANFVQVREVARMQGLAEVRAVVADLGFSSLQLDAPDRGFSFTHTGPLDMRFDPSSGGPSAADVVAATSPKELVRILRMYGEEPYAERIVDALVRERRVRPIRTTEALAELIRRTVRRQGRIDPATRTFQALRIAVNDELAVLTTAIPQMAELVAPGGSIAIVSFHSLEDRIVKRALQRLAASGWGTVCTRKPVRPSPRECQENPRSRSAKLRVMTRGISP